MTNVTNLRPFDKIEIIRKCTGLTATQKLILIVIASHIGKNTFCYIGYSKLQQECCLSSRTSLSQNLSILESNKIIWILPPNEEHKSNRYGIDFDLLVRNAYQ